MPKVFIRCQLNKSANIRTITISKIRKWNLFRMFNNPLGNLMLLFGIGMVIGGLWYLVSHNHVIISW